MNNEVIVKSSSVSSASLMELLQTQLTGEEGVKLELRAGTSLFRPIDATVLIAVISAGSAVLTSLIAGALAIAAKKKSERVVLRGRSGRSLEIPADTPLPQVKQYAELVKELDLESIEF